MDTLPNGAIAISNPPGGMWSDAESWRLLEDLRIGAVDGDGPDVFGQIMQVAFGPQEEILVLDGQAQEVRVFDSHGEHVRTIGGRGGGPGEFANAFGLSWDGDSRLWVADAGNGRYSVFDSAGVYLTSHRRAVQGVVYPWQGTFGPEARLYDVVVRVTPDEQAQFIYLAMDESAVVVDSFPPLSYQPSPAAAIPGAASLRAPRLTFRFDPAGRIWFGMTDEYRLFLRSLSGDTLRIVTRPVEAVPVSESAKDSMIAEATQYSPVPVARSQLPQTESIFNRLLVDDAGNLWVQRRELHEGQGTLFDVIDPDGLFLGEVRSPVALEWMTPAAVHGDRMVGVTRDSLGVQYAVRLRIERPGRTGERPVN